MNNADQVRGSAALLARQRALFRGFSHAAIYGAWCVTRDDFRAQLDGRLELAEGMLKADWTCLELFAAMSRERAAEEEAR